MTRSYISHFEKIKEFFIPACDLGLFAYIYSFKNTENGKIYIGQTEKTIWDRISGHRYGKSNLTKAIKKYGIEHFEIQIIDTAKTQKEADIKEKEYIKRYNSFQKDSGYNIALGGKIGFELPAESKLKMSKGRLGKKITEAHKKAVSNWLKTHRVFTDEYRKNISDAKKGIPMPKAQRKGHAERATRLFGKKIKVVNLRTREDKVFESVRKLSREFNLPCRSLIVKIANGRGVLNTYKNFTFEWVK